MIHRDAGIVDKFEVLCSIPALRVQRLRMHSVLSAPNLETLGKESVIIPLTGSILVEVQGRGRVTLVEKDTYYVSKDASFSVRASQEAEFLWAQAPAEREYSSYLKRFSEIKPVVSGSGTYQRRIYTSIGEKDQANRFIVGFVEGEDGNWTSFPPHKHDGKPEVYVYYGMGKKFGIQVVAGEREDAYLVREGDAVLFERGYHPNVATPGVGMKFVWIISAEPDDRNLSVDLHPEYKDTPMGQTHLTLK